MGTGRSSRGWEELPRGNEIGGNLEWSSDARDAGMLLRRIGGESVQTVLMVMMDRMGTGEEGEEECDVQNSFLCVRED